MRCVLLGGRYEQQSAGLQINNVTSSDEGVYHCQAAVESSGMFKEQTVTLKLLGMYKFLTVASLIARTLTERKLRQVTYLLPITSPFDSACAISCWWSIAAEPLSLVVFEIFAFKYIWNLTFRVTSLTRDVFVMSEKEYIRRVRRVGLQYSDNQDVRTSESKMNLV